MVLVLAIGVMGISYGAWSDTVDIASTVETGDWGVEVTEGTCSDLKITGSATGNVLTVTVTNGVPDSAYDCGLTVSNTGSIPIKIQSIDIDKSGLTKPGEVTITTPGIALGDQIDEGIPQNGTVHVSLTNDAETTFIFTVTFNVVQWNQYVP